MSVLQFVEDAKQDLESPSTSPFPSKMAAYKNMVSGLDEVNIRKMDSRFGIVYFSEGI